MIDIQHLFAAGCSAGQICIDALPHAKQADGSFVQKIISLAIGVTAALSVLFITIGGLRYILAQGDPAAAGKAKGTIIYALIGLLVAIVAQTLVVFVVKRVY